MRRQTLWVLLGAALFGISAGMPASVLAAQEETAAVYSKGSYVAGETIPEGEYVIFSEDPQNLFSTASFSLFKDDSDAKRIRTFSVQNHALVHLYPGQHLVITRGYAMDVNDVELELEPAGMYLAGRDIEPGTYEIRPLSSEGGYYAVYSDVRYYYDYQRDYRRFFEPVTVTLEEGQYLEVGDAASIVQITEE